MLSKLKRSLAKWLVLPVLLLAVAGCGTLSNPPAELSLGQNVVGDGYEVSLPEAWEVESLTGGAMAFSLDGTRVGGVEVLGWYPDEPLSQLTGNHREVIATKKLTGNFTDVFLVKLRMTVPAAAGDTAVSEQYHIYFLLKPEGLAYDLYFEAGRVSEAQARQIAGGLKWRDDGKETGRIVEARLQAIVTNPAKQMHSNPYAYTQDNGDYREIINLGEKALPYLLAQLAGSEENGLREYIIAIACAQIRGESPADKDWATGQEWYEKYVENNEQQSRAGGAAEILSALDQANRVVLVADDAPGMTPIQVALNEEQIQTCREALSKLTSYDMPSPHGSGYPGYRLVLERAGTELMTLEIQDPVYVLDSGKMAYYAGAGDIWALAKSVLPVPSGDRGTFAYLYGADRVTINDVSGNRTEYDLVAEPQLAFRLAALIRLMVPAAVATEVKPESIPYLYFTLTFTVDGRTEVLQVYEDYIVYSGRVYRLDAIGPMLGSNINAG